MTACAERFGGWRAPGCCGCTSRGSSWVRWCPVVRSCYGRWWCSGCCGCAGGRRGRVGDCR